MASIERTAYPRVTPAPSSKDLFPLYTPTEDEMEFAQQATRSASPQLTCLVLLKTFHRLGYFPRLSDVPAPIVQRLRRVLPYEEDGVVGFPEPRTLYRHHRLLREYLGVPAYGTAAGHVAARAVYDAAQTMDNPADLINVASETLIKERYELPGFSTLDRLARRVRTLVNRRFFLTIFQRLSAADCPRLEDLLVVDPRLHRSLYNRLKQLPKRPTLTHLQDGLTHREWLLTLGAPLSPLAGLPPINLQHVAAEAKALAVAEIRDFTPPKRYTRRLCLIPRLRTQTPDHLAEMFLKRMSALQTHAKAAREDLRTRHQEQAVELVSLLADVVTMCETPLPNDDLGHTVRTLVSAHGSGSQLQEACEAVVAYTSANYPPLLWRFYRSHRRTLWRFLHALTFISTSQAQSLVTALRLLATHHDRRSEWLTEPVALSFASERWQRTVSQFHNGERRVNRRHFAVCVFLPLAAELKSGDIALVGSEAYADYRDQLLPWTTCEPLVADYCQQAGLPATAQAFVAQVRAWLDTAAQQADAAYPTNSQFVLDPAGKPVLKRSPAAVLRPSAKALEAALVSRMPERNLLDLLANVAPYTAWPRHFGPLSGADPKLDRPEERYLLTTFAHGCNLGPTQAARPLRGTVSAHTLSFVNRRHVNTPKLNAAIRDILNAYERFPLPKLWGSGQTAAADGTKYELYDQNLLAEYHLRYGSYGGIAYHHVADNYIARFSHFLPCGVWEAGDISEGLLQNTSDIQPKTVHADTQGQSTPVFALAPLLGIKLMPRIRNWQDLILYRSAPETTYTHLDALFTDVIDWQLIETHWQDLLQVVLSLKAGKLSSALLLRKLGNDSRTNRLYQAFRELGRVVRTVFLLPYLSDPQLRQQITDRTNKVEAYNGFAKWLFFGGEGIIAENDPEEQEKMIKYNHLVANAVIFPNVVDQSRILAELIAAGFPVEAEDVMTFSPYLTLYIKRFGEYILDLVTRPQPLSSVELAFTL